MNFYLSFVVQAGIAAIAVILFYILFFRNRNKKVVRMYEASLTCEELEEHARKIAIEHSVSKKRSQLNWPLTRMNENYSYIQAVYKGLNEDVQKKLTIPPAAEWLLDNFYIIEEQVKGLRMDISKEDHARLPTLKCGSLKGYARVYAIALELIAHTNSQIDENILMNYLKAYQSHSVLTDREIWALPAMIRIALIENIRHICEKIRSTQLEWRKADQLLDEHTGEESEKTDKLLKAIEARLNSTDEISQSFIEHLCYRLRRVGQGYAHAVKQIDENLDKHGTTLGDITQKEHNSQAAAAVSIGNGIISLKFISSFDWMDIFEASSHVEDILRRDPEGVYSRMDLQSRSIYRKKVEELAELYGVSELHVARTAVELAGPGKEHVGHYLIGKGSEVLLNKLEEKSKPLKKAFSYIDRQPGRMYFGSLLCITVVLCFLAVGYSAWASDGGSLLPILLAGIAALIPVSEIAAGLVNWLVCKIKKPSSFVRLELKEGIPESLATLVVIPALLTDEKRVKELLENLESHYLANREDNLYFAIAGDFKDSVRETQPEDGAIVRAGLEGVRELNGKYAGEGKDIFFFFHRKRKLNEKQNKWMGWERKRGALTELNDLVLGAEDTSFAYMSATALPFSNIKYIITLDADTSLPIGMAKKMIGTMAHPLNSPRIDGGKGTVVEGYGLLQPRILIDVESSNRSLFSRIFTGQEGMDPYSCAISDVYQDLFGEGIFTGKGIYDLKVFHRVLRDALPENAVLSHDLLEGSYVRAGLVSDLELVDSYPAKYYSYAARLHRWVRGDWQLLPWLGSTVTDGKGRRVENPLNLISRWKIFDNLRRSLLSPAIMLLIVLGFSILPGSWAVWLVVSLLALAVPLVTSAIDTIFSKNSGGPRLKRHIPVMSGFKAGLYQILVTFLFLPYQTYIMLDAILVTVTRVLFSKKNMLEWVTAADVEKGDKNSLRSYWNKMQLPLLLTLVLPVLAFFLKPEALIPGILLFAMWGFSPWAAYRISRPDREESYEFSEEDVQELRKSARKIWRYFEEFMNYKNHYLAPDNFQEDPPRGVAYRTSPTNIGLGLLGALTARDFGFVCTYEMVGTLEDGVTTVEKMEKWNGHLYNWYDTRNLRPLRPRYISTVDSGNLVCYLITLVQGMEEYLAKPLLDGTCANGFRDTVELAGKDGDRYFEAMEEFSRAAAEKPIDPDGWKKALDRLAEEGRVLDMKKSPWKSKADRMIKMLRRELGEFYSWIDFAEPVSHELQDMEGEDREAVENILQLLKENAPLKDLPSLYGKAVEQIDEVLRVFRTSREKDYAVLTECLEKLRSGVLTAAGNAQNFIDTYLRLISRIKSLADNMKFAPLYVEKKHLFSIGYNIEENRLTNSFYDLLASEARQTSFLAIARGEVPPKHWFKMGRALTVVDQYKGLVSWTGTMFEYLMPLLIMKRYKNTLLDETYSFVIRSQKKYGRQRKMPWGASESGFYSLDINHDYQYKAIGVPWLGLKRGLIEDAVATPYATFLALMIDPKEALENLRVLKKEGMDGPYGFYEAIDYTRERLPFGVNKVVVKSFMAHHEGMSLLALNNCLHDNVMQKRFHRDPVVKSAQLLLQEKVPTSVVYTKETKEKVVPFKDVVYKERGSIRKFRKPDPLLPRAHVLSNGNYSVMVTDRGTGYSKNKMVAVTRWREDVTADQYGMFFYIRNTESNALWSAAYAPLYRLPDRYEVTFTADKARFKRIDGDVETITEIVVGTGENAEIRRLSLKNNGSTDCILEVTSYFEAVLAPQSADMAHPAFSNLFIKTEYLPDRRSIIANRRPRSESDKSLWLGNTVVVEGEMVGDVQYETDRMQFIGRGNNVVCPVAIERNKPLSGTSGPVLDPVMSFRVRVRVEPGKTVRVSFVTATGESSETLLQILEKYSLAESIEEAFKMALTRSQVEARYLNIKATETELYQDMISGLLFMSPLRRANQEIIARNRKGQSSLWSYGISGDIPIVLVILRKSDELDILYEVLKAHEFWRLKDVKADIVILNDEENSYTHPLQALLPDVVSSSHAHDIINRPGGVFILNRNNISEEDLSLLFAASRLVFRGEAGTLAEQTKPIQQALTPRPMEFTAGERSYDSIPLAQEELNFFNGLGGFTKDGSEYVIRLEKGHNTPLPWTNVIANPKFGFLVTESGSSYTWNENSRENKLTPWSNDPVSDTPGEVLYVQDVETGRLWTPTPLPIREDSPYLIRHGFGYSVFQHASHGIQQEMTVFVPKEGPVKLSLLRLKNLSGQDRKLALTYYVRPVLGVNDQSTAMHIRTSQDDTGAVLVENPYNEEFAGKIMFADCSERERQITGDRKEFLGWGGLSSPDGLRTQSLSGTVGIGLDPCAVIKVPLLLKQNEEKEVVFTLGQCGEVEAIRSILLRYGSAEKAREALSGVKAYWRDKLGAVEVTTPDSSMNYLLNGWLVYQVISCRLWARSAFYQSGGAFGFRDQLQDSLSVAQLWPELVRDQILLHSRHQFIEGDVQHWWHEPKGKGTRTRFSDDLLWLPYVTAEYIKITGDYGILDMEVPFLEDEQLREFEDEHYGTPYLSGTQGSVYEHCVRAIEKGLRVGSHGIPLMGSGDWNDGMSTVGNRGQGESVWLGWFVYSVLKKFVPISRRRGDEERTERYEKAAGDIAGAIEKNAWDGNWYRRAYFDNGAPLGSAQNSECKIDAIAQAWSVISGAGDAKRVREAMSSLEDYLVDRDSGLIKLLTPPFDEGDLEPGYIKGYVPGVRENGGQYTHGAAWAIIAFAMLGEGDRAWELFELINPINHTRTHIEYSRYKAEPYVMAADVYAVGPHVGRGGWTWYTGSAGWIFRAGIEYILGLKKEEDRLFIDPCIPGKWTEYKIKYRHLDTTYAITVKNPCGMNRGVKEVWVDGEKCEGGSFKLHNDARVHQVEVVMGETVAVDSALAFSLAGGTVK